MAETIGELHCIARRDLGSARTLNSANQEEHAANICVLCQQATEKFLKASLMIRQIAPTKTHDLASLAKRLAVYDSGWNVFVADCHELSTLLSLRYEGDADAEEAAEALAMTERIAAFAEQWIAGST